MAVSVYFNIEVSKGSTYFLGKYYSREYLKVKIPHSNLFQGEYLFPEGNNYLLVTKYWGSKYIPVNDYWGALFFGEYLLTVTPEQEVSCESCLIFSNLSLYRKLRDIRMPASAYKQVVFLDSMKLLCFVRV